MDARRAPARFGIDKDDYESVAGEANVGGWLWRYSTRNPDGVPNNGDEFDVVRRQTTARGTTIKLEQTAYYIEDSWHVTDNFIFYYGGRWDTFKNLDYAGVAFVEIENQFGPAPRLLVGHQRRQHLQGVRQRRSLRAAADAERRGPRLPAPRSSSAATTTCSRRSTRSPACRCWRVRCVR
jgi:outer membrane receptor protein involved in Fe transport